MSEATLSFPNHEHVRTLFGAGDRYLRQLREATGVEVVVRGDELRLHGTDEQIQSGLQSIHQLRSIIERKGHLADADVARVLQPKAPAAPGKEAAIDVFHKARKVHPRTAGQAAYAQAIRDSDLVFCSGPAGCGKTYLAVAMAVNALRQEQVRKIVLVRPAVEAGEKLGFLPGDILAKVNPFLRPLLDSLNDILDFEQVQRYMEKDVIEIVPLAFMRGRTLNSTFMILDEAQNTTVTQMKMFLTRMGTETKIVVTGDTTQIDLPEHVVSGLIDGMERLQGIQGIGTVKLTGQDIVRHRLVREIVRAYDVEQAANQ